MQISHLCLVGFVKDCSYNEQSEVYVFLKQSFVLVNGFTITPRKLLTRKYKENK